MALLALLAFCGPVLDSFDTADSARWYAGAAYAPRDGALRLPRGGFLVSRGVPDGVSSIEIDFRGRGGHLEVSFPDPRLPLSEPPGERVVASGAGRTRTLVVARHGVTLDGERLKETGPVAPVFRLRAVRGDVDLLEVRVSPDAGAPPAAPELERRTVLFTSTPPAHRDEDEGEAYVRAVVPLWDVDVAFLHRRAGESFRLLRGAGRDAPVLAALVAGGEGPGLARRAANSALAQDDWGDERRNLEPPEYERYLAAEYEAFALVRAAQQALNAAVPGRDDLEPLVALAVIRHAENAHAACGLAVTLKERAALAALEKALDGADPASVTGDRLRAAAAEAARKILGEPPPEWPGFSFDAKRRFVTMQRVREIAR